MKTNKLLLLGGVCLGFLAYAATGGAQVTTDSGDIGANPADNNLNAAGNISAGGNVSGNNVSGNMIQVTGGTGAYMLGSIVAANGTGANLNGNNVNAGTGGTISDSAGASMSGGNVAANNVSAGMIQVTGGTGAYMLGSIVAASGTGANLNGNNVNAGAGGTVTGSIVTTGAGASMSGNTVTAANGNITTIDATTGNITTVNATTGNITTVNATTGNITTVNATTGNISTVNANEIYVGAANARIHTVGNDLHLGQNSIVLSDSLGGVDYNTISSSVGDLRLQNGNLNIAQDGNVTGASVQTSAAVTPGTHLSDYTIGQTSDARLATAAYAHQAASQALTEANAYTDSRYRKLRRGIAMTAALQTPTIDPGKDNAVKVSVAGYEGEAGLSAGYARRVADGWTVDVSAASSQDFKEAVVRGGINFSF